jgi:hypothetical protein
MAEGLICLYVGGGVALLYASRNLDKLETANFDQKIGVQIIQNALKVCEFSLLFSRFMCPLHCLMTVHFCRPQCTPLLQMRV